MSDAHAGRARCTATRTDGQPCRGLDTGNGLCVTHRPEASEWRRMGGAATSTAHRANRLLPARLRPLVELLEQAVQQAYAGTLVSPQAALIAPLSRALIAAFSAGMLEERLQALEQAAAETRRERAAEQGQSDDGLRRRGATWEQQ